MRELLCIVLLTITCLLRAMAQGQLTGEIVDNEGIPVIMAAVCYEGNDYTLYFRLSNGEEVDHIRTTELHCHTSTSKAPLP